MGQNVSRPSYLTIFTTPTYTRRQSSFLSLSCIFSQFTAALFVRWCDIASSSHLVFIFSEQHFLHCKQSTLSVGPNCSCSNKAEGGLNKTRSLSIHIDGQKFKRLIQNCRPVSFRFSHWLLNSRFFFTFDKIYFHILHGM